MCVAAYLMFREQMKNRAEQYLRIFVSRKEDSRHIVAELCVGPDLVLLSSKHSAAQIVSTSLVMFMFMAALYYSAELSMEIIDKLSRFLSASQFKAIQEWKV